MGRGLGMLDLYVEVEARHAWPAALEIAGAKNAGRQSS